MQTSILYGLFIALVAISVVLLMPKPLPRTGGGQWVCTPDKTPPCNNTGTWQADGYSDSSDCNVACSYTPPTNQFYNCTGAGGTQPYTCVLSPSPSPYPVTNPAAKSECQTQCVAPNTLYDCVYWNNTPVSTGGCTSVSNLTPTSFKCPPGITECNSTTCPNDGCNNVQCWACQNPTTGGPSQCQYINCGQCKQYGGDTTCWVTTPGQESSYDQYNQCLDQCAPPPPMWACTAGQCAQSSSGTYSSLSACQAACSPPPPPTPCGSGQAFVFDKASNTCVCTTTPTPPSTNTCSNGQCTLTVHPPDTPYATLEDCLCCECGQNNAKYCPGAQQCGPSGILNAPCCNGNYCNPSNCENCIQGTCLSSCSFSPSAAPLVNCDSCTPFGTCANLYCNAIDNKLCVNGVCEDATDCGSPYLQYYDSGDYKWWCPDGSWCADPSDLTKSYTIGAYGAPPGKCLNGTDCVLVSGLGKYPPQGSNGCWPMIQGQPISQLPPLQGTTATRSAMKHK